MSSKIDPTAIIGSNCQIGADNEIGPYVILESGVRMGRGNRIRAGAYLASGTELGDGNDIHMRAVIGHEPQDLAYKGEATFTRIGNQNVIREFVTIHRGTKAGSATVLGNDNFIMAYCHIAHNCLLGDKIIMVNQASLTGHCIIGDGAFLSGMTGLHQFTRVGRLAILSALSAVNKDIPPFMMSGGRPAVVLGLNVVGMRRAGIDPAARSEIKKAYKLLYRSGLNVSQAVSEMKETLKSPEVKELISFIEASDRGILDGCSDEEDQETLSPRKSSKSRPASEAF